MTLQQFEQIIKFCKPYYEKTGRWHAWDHITTVQRLSEQIAQTEFPTANLLALKAAATAHDMGRINKDEGHAEESGRLIRPFLDSIKLPKQDIDTILDAVTHHDVKKIDQSKTIEARIMYDADKIEIFSVYGFTRVAYWLVEERQMELGEAVKFLWDWCQTAKAKLHSEYAKQLVQADWNLLTEYVRKFSDYEANWRKQ